MPKIKPMSTSKSRLNITSTSTTYLDEIADQWANILFTYGLLLVLGATIFPYEFFFKEMANRFDARFVLLSMAKPSVKDVINNLVLFLPFGFGLTCLMRKKKLMGKFALAVILIASTGLSFTVEVLQIFLPSRSPSLADTLANSFGAFLGFLCFRFWAGKILGQVSGLTKRSKEWLSTKNLTASFIGYATLAFLISIPLQSATDRAGKLSNWDQSFPLLLGNEQTGDRSWRGHVFEVSITDRAISKEEVSHTFYGKNLLASYRLTGGVSYHDQTGNLPDLSWQGNPPDTQDGLGVSLTSSHWLETVSPATVLAQRIGETSQFTLITAVATADPTQTGPARIVSLSRDPNHRNFTLGQEKTDLVFRLRTLLSGENGTSPELIVPDVFTDTNPHHLVITYDGMTLRVYMDGLQYPRSLELNPGATLFSYISPLKGYDMRGYQILYYGFIFIPLGLLLALIATISRRRLIFHIISTCSGILSPPLILEGILVIMSGRDMRLENLLFGMAITASFALLFKMQVTSWVQNDLMGLSSSFQK